MDGGEGEIVVSKFSYGISENFGGEGGKMVVETTGGSPEKGK